MEQPSSPLPEKPRASQPTGGYQSQPQFQPLELPQPERFKPSKVFTVGKVALASFSLVFAIAALGLSLSLILLDWQFDSFLTNIIAAAAAGATIVWQAADLLTMAARRSLYRPIHPGAHIGVHIVLDALWILVAVSLALSLSYTLADWTVDSRCGDGYTGSYYDGVGYEYCGWDTFATQGQAARYFGLLEALVAFAVLLAASHLTLAVLACVETHRRRRHGHVHGRGAAKIVYVVAAPGGPVDGRVYYTEVPPPRQAALAPAPAPAAAADAESYGYYAPAHRAASPSQAT